MKWRRVGGVEVLNDVYEEVERLSLPIRLVMLNKKEVGLEIPGKLRDCLERARRVFEGEV